MTVNAEGKIQEGNEFLWESPLLRDIDGDPLQMSLFGFTSHGFASFLISASSDRLSISVDRKMVTESAMLNGTLAFGDQHSLSFMPISICVTHSTELPQNNA